MAEGYPPRRRSGENRAVAVWLAGTAVALLLVAWFLIWLLIYLPCGTIG